ncbi:hypothetical protein [Dietzia cinnamea]|nr:hypothetical protein [Dietzia cinnamea]
MDTFRDKAGEPIGTDIDNWVASFTRMDEYLRVWEPLDIEVGSHRY